MVHPGPQLSMGTVSVTGSLVLIRYVARKSPDRKTVIDLMITDNCRQVLVFTALSTLMVAYPKLCGQEGAVNVNVTLALALFVAGRFVLFLLLWTWCATGGVRYACIFHWQRMSELPDREVLAACRVVEFLLSTVMITAEVTVKFYRHGTGMAMSYPVGSLVRWSFHSK